MKTPFSLVLMILLLVLTSCKNIHMKELNNIWDQVVTSNNSSEEALNLKKLQDYLKKNDISIKVEVIDESGSVIDPASIAENQAIGEVKIHFFIQNKSFNPLKSWKPKELNNLYLLFLE